LLLLAVSYIGYDWYNEKIIQEKAEIYRQGAQEGYVIAVGQIFNTAQTCQPVPVTYNNVTINMIAIECLQE